MKGMTIATRYAKSLVDLAVEQQSLDRIYEDMRFVSDTCSASHELRGFLKSPIIKTDKKIAGLKGLFEPSVSEVTFRFLCIIASRKREMLIPEIAQAVLRQYRTIKKIRTADLVTAVPVDDALRGEVLDALRKYTGSEVELRERVNPSLIGGYILTVEGKQDDTSIRHKLNKLKSIFKEKAFLDN